MIVQSIWLNKKQNWSGNTSCFIFFSFETWSILHIVYSHNYVFKIVIDNILL